MSVNKPLVNKTYLLEKFPGKGGWTYAAIPEIAPAPHAHFGWVRVQGSIDGYELKNCNLQPMGNGRLFLPVKAAIRKQLKKQAGDYVHIILFADELPGTITEELQLCLQDEPGAYEAFLSSPAEDQKTAVEWIYAAKTDELKVARIAELLNKLASTTIRTLAAK